jgi:gliding motility-associated-like protein
MTAALAAGPTGAPGVTYQWTWDDGYSQNTTDSAITRFIPAYTGNGQYPVKLKVTTTGTPSCSSTSDPSTVYVRAKPKADFEPEPPFTTIAKPFFNFINHSVSYDNSTMTYLWNMGPLPPAIVNDRMMTDANPSNVEFSADTGWIPVRLYVTTAHQCMDSTLRNIRVEPDITVFAPNAFYPGSTVDCPDGDPGCNRVFKISAAGYASIEIFVFNRWGQQVFYTNDANQGWDGKFRGEPAPQDVYIYQVNATSFNGKKYKYSGSITMCR